MTAAPRLVLDTVCKEFAAPSGVLPVVSDVSLTVGDGEFVSIIGPSGCGKTTILNMIAGLERPTSGTLLVDGRPITRPGADRGVIFQDYGVFPWLTVKDNIAFGLTLRANRMPKRERERIATRYIELMGLTGFEHAYPKTLSGGMKQRVALARAYAIKSSIFLMDEPFGALDAQARSAMQTLLLEVLRSEGKTVVLVTHSVEEALYLSTRIVVVTARPARVRTIVDVPFEHPRDEELHRSRRFVELQYELREVVMREYATQARLRGEDVRAAGSPMTHREETRA
jgi:NitT/TauT family transport system ATP-binding protein